MTDTPDTDHPAEIAEIELGELVTIHRLLADAFRRQLENPPEGGHKASFLDAARRFLADNGMSLDAGKLRELQRVAAEYGDCLDALPFPDATSGDGIGGGTLRDPLNEPFERPALP